MKLTRKNAPWVFEGGEPYTKIATLELLASLMCVISFPPGDDDADGVGTLTLSGVTDNLGNRFAVSKLMTTKFPLCAAMMQLSSTLATRKMKMKLSWAPRDQNFEADELSNGITHRFDKNKEVKVEPLLRDLKVFNKMVKYGRTLYEDLKERKEVRKRTREDENDRRPRISTVGPLSKCCG